MLIWSRVIGAAAEVLKKKLQNGCSCRSRQDAWNQKIKISRWTIWDSRLDEPLSLKNIKNWKNGSVLKTKFRFCIKKRAFFAWKNCIFLKIKKIVLYPMQKRIPNTRIKFEADRLISFWVTTAATLKNAVMRKTRLKFWLLIFTL